NLRRKREEATARLREKRGKNPRQAARYIFQVRVLGHVYIIFFVVGVNWSFRFSHLVVVSSSVLFDPCRPRGSVLFFFMEVYILSLLVTVGTGLYFCGLLAGWALWNFVSLQPSIS